MILKYKITSLLLAALPLFSIAQLNSPYSRYGAGNMVPQANIANRAMGGISAAVANATRLNTVNPASSANLIYTTLDLGLEYNGINLKSKDPFGSFKSNNALFSYLQLGIPLLNGNKKAFKNKTSWSLNFGLRPVTKINYKIHNKIFNSIDSVQTVYEGEGGINEAFFGSALKLKNFSIGFSTGYLFGSKNYSTRLTYNNDSIHYQNINYETNTRFGGVFLNAGAQYAIKIKGGYLRLGAYGNLQKEYNASRDRRVETYTINQAGAHISLDSVFEKQDEKGAVTLPAKFGVGFAIEKEHLLFGVDFETTKWNQYRFFGEKDLVKNSWVAKAGIQYLPASLGSTGYFNFVKYRMGFSLGKDYIAVENDLPVYTLSVGGAFPLKLQHSFYDNQYSVMNVTFEYGKRGNKENKITESIYKISLGFSLSDVWFLRQKYQ